MRLPFRDLPLFLSAPFLGLPRRKGENVVRKTDINRYAQKEKSTAGSEAAGVARSVGRFIRKFLLTVFTVLMIIPQSD